MIIILSVFNQDLLQNQLIKKQSEFSITKTLQCWVILQGRVLQRLRKSFKLLENYDKICLINIGSYFSSSINMLKTKSGNKLLGVVEDTENGHQKYERTFSGKVNIISVARSPLKIIFGQTFYIVIKKLRNFVKFFSLSEEQERPHICLW